MMAAWRLRCLPVLMLTYYVLATVEGTSADGSGVSSSRAGQDRRNGSHKQRRSTTPQPQESSTKPQLNTTSVDPTPSPWSWEAPKTEERVRHGKGVKVTRKTIHGGKTKARKNGTHKGHVTATTETEFSTTGTLLLVTNHVIPSDTVTPSARAEGPRRARPSGGGKPVSTTRMIPETTEVRQQTTDQQRTHRVKTAVTSTSTPTLMSTTTIATPLITSTNLPARKHSTMSSTRTVSFRYSNRTTSHSNSTRGEGCSSSCEMNRCETVEAEMCQGRVVKDRCNCCPVCFVERSTDESRTDATTRKTSHHPNNACEGMQCPKHKVCILNIQGIPMCRCPNIYSCKGIERNPLCGQDGVTYKNKCFLKVEECTIGHRIRVEHRGSCRSKPTPAQLETSVMMWKTARFDSDHRTQQTSPLRKSSGKNDPWRHAATSGGKTKSTKLRKRSGNKSKFS